MILTATETYRPQHSLRPFRTCVLQCDDYPNTLAFRWVFVRLLAYFASQYFLRHINLRNKLSLMIRNYAHHYTLSCVISFATIVKRTTPSL
jgi:hypothetical protein